MAAFPTSLDDRETYATAFERAKRYALRYVADDQARDLAHDVAVSIVSRRIERGATPAEERSMNALIYRVLMNRLIDRRRVSGRRAAAEQVHAADLDAANAWASPQVSVETQELTAIMRQAIAAMPPTMRRVFLLVRDHDRSYREVADELGIGVATVHTHLSRAYALLRETITRYREAADDRRAHARSTTPPGAKRRKHP